MKIHIGKNINEPGGFAITTDNGQDITKELMVKRIVFRAGVESRPFCDLTIDLQMVELDLDLLPDDIRIIDRDGERRLDREELEQWRELLEKERKRMTP